MFVTSTIAFAHTRLRLIVCIYRSLALLSSFKTSWSFQAVAV